MADKEARKAALGPKILSLETPGPALCSLQGFEYTAHHLETVQSLGADYDQGEKVWRHQGKLLLPQKAVKELLSKLHPWTHLEHKKLKILLQREEQTYYIHNLNTFLQQITSACAPYAKVNAKRLKLPEGTRVRGEQPETNWEVDFTEIKPSSFGNRYLLVFIDTFSGWTEAFPTKRETAQVVVKKILEEIFPRFGLPKVIGSDNGPAFISQARLHDLQIIQNQICKPLAAVYWAGNPAVPHLFQIGDTVYIRRHQSKTLEPLWKGPYIVLLTTPTALKVDGVAA